MTRTYILIMLAALLTGCGQTTDQEHEVKTQVVENESTPEAGDTTPSNGSEAIKTQTEVPPASIVIQAVFVEVDSISIEDLGSEWILEPLDESSPSADPDTAMPNKAR
jgi:hypothetical protein